MKEFSFPNSGTCSKQTNFVLNDDHTIESMEVIGGCNGNLKGICSIVRGMKAEKVIERFEGVNELKSSTRRGYRQVSPFCFLIPTQTTDFFGCFGAILLVQSF